MKRLAIIGAGGKMGMRITKNTKDIAGYAIKYVENGGPGIERLKSAGVCATPLNDALADADIAVMALPDKLIGSLGQEIVPQLPRGAMVVLLDPAAAHAGVLPKRDDIKYFVTHPCHPPLFHDETTPEARGDWFGGQGLAKQDIVCAIHQGTDADYQMGEGLAKVMFAPVMNAYRITVEQMGMLEPALVETFTSTLIAAMREAMDKVVAMGVPKAAAQSFLMGHVRIQFAVLFNYADFPFSDGAYLAMSRAREHIFKSDWLKNILDPENIRISVKEITDSLGK